MSTSRSRRRTTPPCGRSTPPRSTRATRTTVGPASAPSTTRATTARSSWTPTGTTSRSSTTTAERWPTTPPVTLALDDQRQRGEQRTEVGRAAASREKQQPRRGELRCPDETEQRRDDLI